MNLGHTEIEVPMGMPKWKCSGGGWIDTFRVEREVWSINIMKCSELGSG